MACSEPCTAACGRLVWLGETEMKAYAMSFDGALFSWLWGEESNLQPSG